MEVINYLKQLYKGKGAIYRHITLFSILGIMVILLNNIFATVTNSLALNFFIAKPSSNIELILDFFVGFLLMFYILGYEYKFINNIINSDEISLPEFNSQPFGTFFKILPVFLLWQLYYMLISYFGNHYINTFQSSVYSYIFNTVLLCLIPFILMIYIRYSADFKLTKEVILPWVIFKYIDGTIVDIVVWCVEFGIFIIIPSLVIFGFAEAILTIKNDLVKLACIILGLSINAYIITIFRLVFNIGISKIVKKKFLDNTPEK